MRRYLFLLLFLLSANGFSQIRLSGTSGDFFINDEYSPATFIQKEPKLFPLDNTGFKLVWKDYREGNAKFYAQNFNAFGEPIDSNHSTEYSRFCYSKVGNTLEIRTETNYDDYFGGGTYSVYGNILKPDGSTCGEKAIAYVELPWCGTGWMGIHEDFKPIGDGFVYFLNAGGSVGVKRSDENCNVVYDSFQEEPKSYLAANISGAVTSDNYFAMFYYQSSEGSDLYDTGVYGIFYDPDNNIVVDTMKIFNFDYDFLMFDEAPKVYAAALSNDTYLIITIDQHEKKVLYQTLTKTGFPVTNPVSIDLNGTLLPSDYSRITRFFTSPISDIGFQLFFTIVDGNYDSESVESYILKFNGDGSLFGQIYNSDYSFPDIGQFVYNKTGNVFFAPHSDEKDVFLSELNDFDFTNNSMVNDDIFGGNQSSPAVSIRNDGTFFAMWENEETFFGKAIDGDGNIVSEEYELYNTHAKFFNNGNAIAACKRFCGADWKAGYRILDSNMVSVRTELIARNIDGYMLQITGEVISDNLALVEYVNNDSIFVLTVDDNGDIVNEKFIAEISYPSGLGIYKENEKEFWVRWYNGAKKLDSELNVIDEFNGYFTSYIGNDLFLFVYNGDNPKDIFFNILDKDHNVIAEKIPVAKDVTDWKVSRLSENSDVFLFMYLQEKILATKAFTNRGEEAGPAVWITQNTTSNKKLGAFKTIGDKIIFVWSDDRLQTTGYDIFSSVFKVNDIATDVSDDEIISERFELKQNYPNPFNPSTIIEYSVPESFSGNTITLKVYNSIGKEIATLVNNDNSAGRHKIIFDGSGLASGVYYFSLRAGEKFITKKGILLK